MEFRITIVTDYESPLFDDSPIPIEEDEFRAKPNPRMKYISLGGGRFFKVSKEAWINMLQDRNRSLAQRHGQDEAYIVELEAANRTLCDENVLLRKQNLAAELLRQQKRINAQGKKLGDAKTQCKIYQDQAVALAEEVRALKERISELEFQQL